MNLPALSFATDAVVVAPRVAEAWQAFHAAVFHEPPKDAAKGAAREAGAVDEVLVGERASFRDVAQDLVHGR